MKADTPRQVHELWAAAFSRGDLHGLLQLYEPDAVLVPSPGDRFEGHEAIREALDGFLALRPAFEMTPRYLVQSGDIAVLFSPWKLVGSGPDGSEVRMTGITADVVRRQPDGSWLMVIDNPFGGNPSICG